MMLIQEAETSMTFFDCSKSIIENIYFLTSPLIFISIIVAIYQYIHSKEVQKTNSLRESRRYSLDLFLHLTNFCRPIEQEIIQFKKETGIKFDKFELDGNSKFTTDELTSAKHEEALKNFSLFIEKDGHDNIFTQMVLLLDELEHFAAAINFHVAEDDSAYRLCSHLYCSLVEMIYPVIASGRDNINDNDSFQVVDLYKDWKNQESKNKIENDLNDYSKQLDAIKIKKRKPLGT